MKTKTSFVFSLAFLASALVYAADKEILVDPKNSILAEDSKPSEAPKVLTESGLSVIFSSTSVSQGGAFWVEAAVTGLTEKAQGWAEIDRIPTPLFPYKNAKGESVLAGIVGIPHSEKPGPADVTVKVSDVGIDKQATAKIIVFAAEVDRTAELLRLPEERVIPNLEGISKLSEEDKEIDYILNIRSDKRYWDMPLELPFDGKYRMSSPYGKTRIYSARVQRRVHWGVDYALPVGTRIRASLPGRVVMAKEFGFMGKTVVLDHGYGMMTVYAHLKDIKVALGQELTHRQIIGASGISGKSTGPLIHWMVTLSGVKVDPLIVRELMSAKKQSVSPAAP